MLRNGRVHVDSLIRWTGWVLRDSVPGELQYEPCWAANHPTRSTMREKNELVQNELIISSTHLEGIADAEESGGKSG